MSKVAPVQLGAIDVPEQPAAAPAGFEILATNVELDRPRAVRSWSDARQGTAPALSGAHVYGDIARLSSGLTVARVTLRDADGSAMYRYSVHGENPRAIVFEEPRNWPEYMRSILERWELGPGTHLVGPRTQSDFQRFVADYPAVAAKLKIQPEPIPKPIFPVGQARYRKDVYPTCDFRDYLDRHAGGDWGAAGSYSEDPLTPEQKWAIGIQPIEIQNRHAIRSGRGVVRSRFPFSETASRRYACTLCTLLGPGPIKTLIDVESVNVS